MRKRLPIGKMLTVGLLPSGLKKMYYWMKGYRFGRGVRLSIGCVLDICKGGRVYIGNYSKIGFFTVISGKSLYVGKRSNIRSGVLISANDIMIGDYVTISETAIIRAGHLSKESNIRIDDYVHIFPSTNIDPSRNVHLMEGCAVGPKCDIFTHGSYKNIFDGYPVSYGDVTIGKRVELTYSVFVAPGVTIGDDAIIAYGSYINKDIPSGVLAAGTPAIVKREKEQFVAEHSTEEKFEILSQILKEFGEYLIYMEIIDYYDMDECRLSLVRKKKRVTIYFAPTASAKTIAKDDILISLKAENPDCQGAAHYYNIDDLTCSEPTSEIEKELFRFFSRYGVRFTIDE